MRGGTGKPVAAGVKLACCQAAVLLRLAALSFAGILVLTAVGFGSAAAQETISIRGQVVNGTAGGDLGEGFRVLLLVTDADGGTLHTGEALAGPDGRFVLNEVPRAENGNYGFGVESEGVFYGRSVSLEEVLEEVELTVYEATDDASNIRVTRHIMVIAGVNIDDREISAIEFVQLTNSGDRTLFPDRSNPTTFLRFALPPQATELDILEYPPPGGSIMSIDTGFALISPVVPGDHKVTFAFRFPYEGNRVAYRQSLPQGADLYQLLLPRQLQQIQVRPLRPVPPVDDEISGYLVWEETEIGRGQGLALELANLPQPGLASRLWDTVTGEVFWQIAIPSVVGAALAVLLLLGGLRSSRPASLPAGPANGEIENGLTQWETLVQEVASLDEEFQNGTLPEDEYRRQRDALLSRLRGITWQADDAGEGPQ